jgi:hypothetical protein
MSRDREYHQAHNKGMTVDQRREWVRKKAKEEDNKNLPFTFSKPPRRRGRTWSVGCRECDTALTISRNTFIAVCPKCGLFNKFKDGEPVVEEEEKEEDND